MSNSKCLLCKTLIMLSGPAEFISPDTYKVISELTLDETQYLANGNIEDFIKRLEGFNFTSLNL